MTLCASLCEDTKLPILFSSHSSSDTWRQPELYRQSLLEPMPVSYHRPKCFAFAKMFAAVELLLCFCSLAVRSSAQTLPGAAVLGKLTRFCLQVTSPGICALRSSPIADAWRRCRLCCRAAVRMHTCARRMLGRQNSSRLMSYDLVGSWSCLLLLAPGEQDDAELRWWSQAVLQACRTDMCEH